MCASWRAVALRMKHVRALYGDFLPSSKHTQPGERNGFRLVDASVSRRDVAALVSVSCCGASGLVPSASSEEENLSFSGNPPTD